MARYTDAVCRQCRREGQKLFLKGDRCYTGKCSVVRRAYAPGQHGQGRNRKLSEYGLQLREKQKARRYYGVLENQFLKYYKEAARRPGQTGENLLRLLETRLDNVVYRMGLANSHPEARQLVNHGHFTVNGRKVNIPSYLVKPSDVIALREKSRSSEKFKGLTETAGRGAPEWLPYNKDTFSASVTQLPTREQMDLPIDEQLIVEYYSR
ncbi:MAG: 30S ribosomal protein S4 [Oscillospiraceae bacterium]|nr:30S ribosomal protein S4 [Oscillospiraceae bacterium]